jgi:hypothetical protein
MAPGTSPTYGIADVHPIRFGLTDVDTRHLETGAGEFHGQWQAHTTQPDNSHAGAAGTNLLFQVVSNPPVNSFAACFSEGV